MAPTGLFCNVVVLVMMLQMPSYGIAESVHFGSTIQSGCSSGGLLQVLASDGSSGKLVGRVGLMGHRLGRRGVFWHNWPVTVCYPPKMPPFSPLTCTSPKTLSGNREDYREVREYMFLYLSQAFASVPSPHHCIQHAPDLVRLHAMAGKWV